MIRETRGHCWGRQGPGQRLGSLGRKAPGGLGTPCVLGDVLPYHTEPFTRCCRHIQVDFASRVTALFLPARPALQDAGGYVLSERRDTFYIHFARVVWFLLLAFVLGQIC